VRGVRVRNPACVSCGTMERDAYPRNFHNSAVMHMMRVLLIATAIGFVVVFFRLSRKGVVAARIGVAPNRCSGGYMSGNAPRCMIACVEAVRRNSSPKNSAPSDVRGSGDVRSNPPRLLS
jgi:hypothetical protein